MLWSNVLDSYLFCQIMLHKPTIMLYIFDIWAASGGCWQTFRIVPYYPIALLLIPMFTVSHILHPWHIIGTQLHSYTGCTYITASHWPFRIPNQFNNLQLAAYYLVYLTNFISNKVKGQFVFDATNVIIANMLCCQETNKLGWMFTLWYMAFPPILFISQQQDFFYVNYTSTLDLWYAKHLAGYFCNLLSLLTCQSNISDVRPSGTVV